MLLLLDFEALGSAAKCWEICISLTILLLVKLCSVISRLPRASGGGAESCGTFGEVKVDRDSDCLGYAGDQRHGNLIRGRYFALTSIYGVIESGVDMGGCEMHSRNITQSETLSCQQSIPPESQFGLELCAIQLFRL